MIRKKLNSEPEQEQEGGKPGQPLGRKNLQPQEGPADSGEGGDPAGSASSSDTAPENLPSAGPVIGDTGELAGEIVSLFGKDNMASLQQAFARLNILPGNEEDTPASWLTHIFNSYFTRRQIEGLCGYYNGLKSREQRQKEEVQLTMDSLLRDLAGIQDQLAALDNTRKAQEETITESQRKLKSALPAPTVSQWLCNELPLPFGSLKALLLDEAGDEAALKCRFIIRLLPSLWDLAGVLSDQSRDKEENRSRIDGGLMKVLSAITGLHIVNRREVLDAIAKVCSDSTENWVFVSPESSLVVDPAIHNAKALSGTTVKEGISFAIIRKDSRQTIKLADITVI